MSVEYRIEAEREFLRLSVSGEWTQGKEVEETRKVWAELAEACEQQGMSRVMAVYDIPGRFPTMAAYNFASAFDVFGWKPHWKVALVYHYQERFESNLFTENVAVNRGFRVKAFTNESDAETWLTDQPSK